MDKRKADQISKDVYEALAPLEEKHGVKFQDLGGNFTATSLQFKTEAAEIGKEGIAETRDLQTLRAMNPEVIDKVYRYANGRRIKFIGFSPRRHRYPYTYQDQQSWKTYKCTRAQFENIINSNSSSPALS